MRITEKDKKVARIVLRVISIVFWGTAGYSLALVSKHLEGEPKTLLIHAFILICLGHFFSLKAEETRRI